MSSKVCKSIGTSFLCQVPPCVRIVMPIGISAGRDHTSSAEGVHIPITSLTDGVSGQQPELAFREIV